jgi:hypothetical protein
MALIGLFEQVGPELGDGPLAFGDGQGHEQSSQETNLGVEPQSLCPFLHQADIAMGRGDVR